VFKAIRKSDEKIIALKVMDIDSTSFYGNQEIENEISQLQKIQPECHNLFVVCYYDHHYDKELQKYYIEMEYVEGVTLENFMKILSRISDDNTYTFYLMAIIRDIAKGLEYIHGLNIVHNDIKPANIMIQPDYTPKIIDFGGACKYIYPPSGFNYCFNPTITPFYTPPEIITAENKKKRISANDMWSLGVSIYELVVGERAFDAANKERLYKNIVNKQPNMDLIYNPVIKSIVQGLLNKDPEKRYTANMVVKIIEDNILDYKPVNPSPPPVIK